MAAVSAPDPPPQEADNALPPDEFFQIIDETGEGFGFDLTPEALAKPLAIGTGALFTLGMLAGIPFGLAMGRSEETGAKGPKGRGAAVRPSLDGVKFAASTFGLGTLLCASVGVTSFFAVKHYYGVESFEEFGAVMRRDVPLRRDRMEAGLAPFLGSLRKAAGDNLPQPVKNLRDNFGETRFGRWLKSNIDLSVTVDPVDDNVTAAANASESANTSPPLKR